MLKTLGVIVGGIFVGAVAVEIVHSKWPNKLDKFYTKANSLTAGIRELFVGPPKRRRKSLARVWFWRSV